MRVCIVVMAAFAIAAAAGLPAEAQQARHAEDCSEPGWGYLRSLEFRFGTLNTCGEAIHIWFKVRGRNSVDAEVEAGHTFDTGLTIADFEQERQANGWIAATCPAGTTPSIEFVDDNWDELLNSRYECR